MNPSAEAFAAAVMAILQNDRIPMTHEYIRQREWLRDELAKLSIYIPTHEK